MILPGGNLPKEAVRKDRFLVVAALGLACLTVFYFQPDEVLFGPGHLGWVSSHTLAIIRHATPERWFLGFTCEFTGANNLAYFDRYPVVFSGLMHLLLDPFKDSFSEYISWARVYMNAIYVLSMIVGYKVACLFTRDRPTALAATLFNFMGVFFVFYKDMIHFDQPAVLGILALFYAIARYEIHGDRRWIWPAAAVVLVGRGYASNFLLLLWNILFVASLIRRSQFRLSGYLRSVPFGVFLLAGVLSFGALSFNVLSEARITNVSWHETSIVKSAESRLQWGFEADFESESTGPSKTDFIPFTREQLKRTVGGLVPFGIYPYQGEHSPEPNWILIGIYLLALLGALLLSVMRTDLAAQLRRRKRLVALGLLAGFFWLYPMRNLAAFHNYTHMYNVLFYLLFFSASFYWFRSSRAAWGLVGGALALFIYSQATFYDARIDYNRAENRINSDIDRIKRYLSSNNLDEVHVAGGHRHLIEGSPYAACLYLSDFKIADEASEASVIVAREELEGEPLLPGLDILNVYRAGH